MTVVALEQAVALPLATRHLADLGARVIKVERPDGGDFARRYDDAVAGLASHFVWLNRSKESLTLDLKTEDGRATLERLLADSDVFVSNLAPGAVARLGFGAEALRARHHHLVVVELTGYGSSGPYRDRRAYDMLIQCEAGLASVTGPPETPAKTGIPASDIAAGMYVLVTVLAGLYERARGGDGARAEVSMLDATAEWMGYQLHYTAATGRTPPRAGLSHPSIAPYDAYPTRDGRRIMIGIQNDREWVRFATGFLNRPELVTDPDWATNVARTRHRNAVDEAVAAATAQFDLEDAEARLAELGIATARLNAVADVLAHPQLAARDRWREIRTPVGPVRALLPPPVFPDRELRMDAVPALGEHTAAIQAELAETPADASAGLITGSYPPDDVTLLFTDLTDRLRPLPEDQVAALARATAGHGHRSVVPVEPAPSPATLALFDELLDDLAPDTALLCCTLARQLVDDRAGEPITLLSIARAGTPVGVVVHRLLRQRYGLASTHYSISLIPHVGVDVAALRHLLARHRPETVRFLDGWSGKGGIATVLAAELARVAPLLGARLDDRLAVLTDPGQATTLAATTEDVLIPSAVLNAPVSGLLSRSVVPARSRSDALHGAIRYPELAGCDRSLAFVEAVCAAATSLDEATVEAAAQRAARRLPPTFPGWAFVAELADEYGLPDALSFVKPGLNEACRALVARQPARVLIDPGRSSAATEVIVQLAKERGVPVDERSMPYAAVGLAAG